MVTAKTLKVIDPRTNPAESSEAKTKGVQFGGGQLSDIVRIFGDRVFILGIYEPKPFPRGASIMPGVTKYSLWVWAKPGYEKTLTRSKIQEYRVQLKRIAGQGGDSGFFAKEQLGGVLLKGTALIGGFALGTAALGAAVTGAGAASAATPIVTTAKPASSLFAGLEGFGGKIVSGIATAAGKLGAAGSAAVAGLAAKKGGELFSNLTADKTTPESKPAPVVKAQAAPQAGGFPYGLVLLGMGGIFFLVYIIRK